MGKSSLMIRTAERLAEEGARPVIVDRRRSARRLRPSSGTRVPVHCRGSAEAHDQRGSMVGGACGPVGRSSVCALLYRSGAHRTIRTDRHIVDEIDTTLRLNFTDDFFAGIRYLYQARAGEPELQRLSFVLIGVATPGDLVKDAARTPFNVGHRIDLTDFTLGEALPLVTSCPSASMSDRT